MLFPEIKRKAVHLIMGTFCLTLPWILPEPWQFDLLALVSLALLFAIRFFKPALGHVLHSVERLTFGELLFPVGVTLVYRLADGELSLYLPAIAIMTFADAAGALVGKQFGRHVYRTNAGEKSIEGSIAVFVVSFIIVFISGISDDLLTSFLIAIVVALVATMAEGILSAGIDNLVLPLTVAALLYFLRELTWGELLARITLISGIGIFLSTIRLLTSLNGGGMLSATIFGYLSFALGGVSFLYAPMLLFLIHLLTTCRFPELGKMEHSATSVSAVALPALIWVITKENSSYPTSTCLVGFTITLVAQTAFLHSATRAHLKLPTGMLIGTIKIIVIALSALHQWPVWTAASLLVVTLPVTGSLNRISQAFLAYLLSLLALLS